MGQRVQGFKRVAVVAVVVLAGCSDSESPEAGAEAGPCSWFTAADAKAMLDREVRPIGLAEAVEAADGPIADEDLPLVEEAATRNCLYRSVDSEAYVGFQLDRSLFASADEFESAWGPEAEILDGPGLAASYSESSDPRERAVSVLLNEAGDSFALVSYRSDVDRETLLGTAAELTDRFND